MYKIKGLEKYRRPIPALNDRQLNAIHDSLAKWQFLSWHPENDDEPDCVCCDSFYLKDCDSCPIKLITDRLFCHDSPYNAWAKNDCDYPEAEDEYHFLEGIYSIELHRRKYGKMYE